MPSIWLYIAQEVDISFKRTFMEGLLRAGLHVVSVTKPPNEGPGLILFSSFSPDLFQSLRQTSSKKPDCVVTICLSSELLQPEESWKLLAAGATDVLYWDHLSEPYCQITERFARWESVDALLLDSRVKETLIGQSRIWLNMLRQVAETAHFTQASALITGESGTGKELVAHLIHALDNRPEKKDFVVLDCTTIVPELSGSEFFGHEKGAFTGAFESRNGAFSLANKGTLFLDEIGELPLRLQAQLLRVIQEGTYKRVGGNTWYETQFRLVCATNRNLVKEVEKGRFRKDLYFRIANFICSTPPLRERREDILLLAIFFVKNFLNIEKCPGFDPAVTRFLQTRDYPGNVRELKQLVSRLCQKYLGQGFLTVGTIPPEERPQTGINVLEWMEGAFTSSVRGALVRGAGLKDIRLAAEEVAIRIVVDEEKGNLQKSSKRLGLTDRTLQLRRAARGKP